MSVTGSVAPLLAPKHWHIGYDGASLATPTELKMLQRILPVLALVSSAMALPLLPGCGDSPDTVDASTIDAAPIVGNFSLSWTIVDGGETLSCANVGAAAVSIRLTRQGSGSGEAESFPCASGQGVSRAFAPGLYDVTIDLRAAGSVSLIAAPVRVQGFEIVANQESALPAQEFEVEAVGNFNFFVDAGTTGGNCAALAADGAGIIGLAFSLQDGSGSCIAADFVIADGSETGGTYSTDCTAAPAPFPCIGADQEVSVSNAPSGTRRLVITGQKEGPVDCYEKVSNFSLPGANLVKGLGTLLLGLRFSSECDPNFSQPDAGA